MRRRLLDLCVLAYPRARRRADREYLRDLALDLAERHGTARQAASLLRGGIGERFTGFRRRAAARARATWSKRAAVGSAAATVLAIAATVSIGPASGIGEAVEVEREVCEYSDAPGRAAVARRCARGPARSIDRFLDAALPAGASGTLVAARDGEVYCRTFGFADRKRRTPTTCNTVYDVMSMTKQFTAAAILKLEMFGELDVTDPIGEYIGDVPADKQPITIHHLLTHTAGLPGAIGDDYERLTRRRLVARALGSELRSPPGSAYHYSNVGYSILAAIVDKLYLEGYEAFLSDHVFRPAGMTQTGYVLPEWKRSRVAVEYDARGRPQGRPFDHPWGIEGPSWNLRGNGGMLSTARDMIRWHRALEGDAILDDASKAKLFAPHVLEEPSGDTHYGYGWVIGDEPGLGRVAWHDGGNGWSYGLVARRLDERAMAFWVTNRYRNAGRGWNLARLGPGITRGVIKRLDAGT